MPGIAIRGTMSHSNQNPKTPRFPAARAEVAVLTGAVLLKTADGSIVITPKLAAQLAQLLPKAAFDASRSMA